MDQNKIVEALQEALTKGTGSLDDLDKLLARAREDIVTAKKDEAEAAKKAKAARGETVAKMATRILNSEMTDDDMAFIMNVFFEQHDLKPIWTGETIKSLITECDERTNEYVNTVNDAVKSLTDLLNETFNLDLKPEQVNVKVGKPKRETNKKDPDDVINDFLKKFGLA